jgi:hypothetical protein
MTQQRVPERADGPLFSTALAKEGGEEFLEVTSNSTKMAIMAVAVRANSTVAEDIDRGCAETGI